MSIQAVQKSVVKEEIALPEPGHGSTPGQGSTPSKVKVKTEKRSNHTNGNEIPLVSRGEIPLVGRGEIPLVSRGVVGDDLDLCHTGKA